MIIAVGVAHGQLLASGDNSLGAGFIGFMVVLVMAVAAFFLFRSMSRHLKKVPATFEPPAPSHDEP